MHISIKATNYELTLPIREYVEKRCRSFEKFFSEKEDPHVSVELGKTTNHHNSGDIFRAEMQLTRHGALLRAESKDKDLYRAIDDAHDELFREISSQKEKRLTRWIRKAHKVKEMIKGLRPWKK